MNLVSDAEVLNQDPHSGKDKREEIAVGGIFTQGIADWVWKVRVNVAQQIPVCLLVTGDGTTTKMKNTGREGGTDFRQRPEVWF